MLFTCRFSALLSLLSSTLLLTLARPQYFPHLADDAFMLPTPTIPDINSLPTLTIPNVASRLADDAFILPTPTIPSFDCAPTLITATHITTSVLEASRVTVLTVNRVQTIPHSCYVATVTATRDNCSFNSATCIEAHCLIASTTTVPCVDFCCSTTQTVTSTMPCETACRVGCATMMATATPTSC